VNVDGDPVIGDFVAGTEGKDGVLVIALSGNVGDLMDGPRAAKKKKKKRERTEMRISKASWAVEILESVIHFR
jgi:hypothetical protein